MLCCRRNQIKAALAEGLNDPPHASKDEAIKVRVVGTRQRSARADSFPIQALNARAIVGALTKTEKKDIKGLVGGLTSDQADVAMKHVFKGTHAHAHCL